MSFNINFDAVTVDDLIQQYNEEFRKAKGKVEQDINNWIKGVYKTRDIRTNAGTITEYAGRDLKLDLIKLARFDRTNQKTIIDIFNYFNDFHISFENSAIDNNFLKILDYGVGNDIRLSIKPAIKIYKWECVRMEKDILDACCGSRMFWHNKDNPLDA